MGKQKFTAKDVAGMKKTEQRQAADRNPYSWNMVFLPYPDGSGYEARFNKCGICTLMRELGLDEYIPACAALTIRWLKQEESVNLSGNILWPQAVLTVIADTERRMFNENIY